jgi:hypothetical protein
MTPAMAKNLGFGGHAEASDCSWESLPHGIFGARPAGPCTNVRARLKPKPERHSRGERLRRQNPPVLAAELNAALDRRTWRGPATACDCRFPLRSDPVFPSRSDPGGSYVPRYGT